MSGPAEYEPAKFEASPDDASGTLEHALIEQLLNAASPLLTADNSQTNSRVNTARENLGRSAGQSNQARGSAESIQTRGSAAENGTEYLEDAVAVGSESASFLAEQEVMRESEYRESAALSSARETQSQMPSQYQAMSNLPSDLAGSGDDEATLKSKVALQSLLSNMQTMMSIQGEQLKSVRPEDTHKPEVKAILENMKKQFSLTTNLQENKTLQELGIVTEKRDAEEQGTDFMGETVAATQQSPRDGPSSQVSNRMSESLRSSGNNGNIKESLRSSGSMASVGSQDPNIQLALTGNMHGACMESVVRKAGEGIEDILIMLQEKTVEQRRLRKRLQKESKRKAVGQPKMPHAFASTLTSRQKRWANRWKVGPEKREMAFREAVATTPVVSEPFRTGLDRVRPMINTPMYDVIPTIMARHASPEEAQRFYPFDDRRHCKRHHGHLKLCERELHEDDEELPARTDDMVEHEALVENMKRYVQQRDKKIFANTALFRNDANDTSINDMLKGSFGRFGLPRRFRENTFDPQSSIRSEKSRFLRQFQQGTRTVPLDETGEISSTVHHSHARIRKEHAEKRNFSPKSRMIMDKNECLGNASKVLVEEIMKSHELDEESAKEALIDMLAKNTNAMSTAYCDPAVRELKGLQEYLKGTTKNHKNGMKNVTVDQIPVHDLLHPRDSSRVSWHKDDENIGSPLSMVRESPTNPSSGLDRYLNDNIPTASTATTTGPTSKAAKGAPGEPPYAGNEGLGHLQKLLEALQNKDENKNDEARKDGVKATGSVASSQKKNDCSYAEDIKFREASFAGARVPTEAHQKSSPDQEVEQLTSQLVTQVKSGNVTEDDRAIFSSAMRLVYVLQKELHSTKKKREELQRSINREDDEIAELHRTILDMERRMIVQNKNVFQLEQQVERLKKQLKLRDR